MTTASVFKVSKQPVNLGSGFVGESVLQRHGIEYKESGKSKFKPVYDVMSLKLKFSKESPWTAEASLWFAVFEQALFDGFSCSKSVSPSDQQSALTFIYGNGGKTVLEMIGIDHDYALVVISKVIENSVPCPKKIPKKKSK